MAEHMKTKTEKYVD
jgi:hypothetical protein